MTARPWTAQEISLLRRKFANSTNTDLAEMLGRSVKSVANQAAALCLSKSAAHRSRQSRKTALEHLPPPEEMAARGALGGAVGGPARMAALSPAERAALGKKGGTVASFAKRRAKRRDTS